MGCVLSQPVMATDATTAEVEKQLQEAQDKEQYQFKILLLGAGESGKSTVVKQVKLIYKGVVTAKEKEEYTHAIRRNVIDSMQTMLDAMDSFDIALARPGSAEAAQRVRAVDAEATLEESLARDVTALWADEGMRATYDRRDEFWLLDASVYVADAEATLEEFLARDVTALWADEGVRATCDRRDEFWLLDASQYYFEEALRLAEPDYEPTDEDMIMTRVRTTGIVVTDFEEKPYSYSLVDVGGQRSERRKWIHCFDDVKAIIFLEGLSGYHQVLFEDTSVNRMHESLQLFEEIVKNPIFVNTPIFVFLNKKDLFEQMIAKTSLKVCFPEYDGPEGEARPALEFIEKKYKDIMDKYCPGKGVIIHVVAARVRMDMKIAFGEVKEQIKSIYAERAGKKKRK